MSGRETAEALGERLLNEINGAMSILNLYVGFRLGLFDTLARLGPASTEDLAAASGCHVRYIREWLGAMAAGGYVAYDPAGHLFSLTGEQAKVMTQPEHPCYALANVAFLPSLAAVLPRLLRAFGDGGGIPFEDYGQDLVDAQGAGYRPIFENELVQNWIAAMPDMERRLAAGARVADVGCGVGWSAITLARAFPASRIDGVDPDARSIAEARRNAEAAGVADRVAFHEATIETAPRNGSYDLVTLFECLHDMAYPVEALRGVRGRLKPDGAVLITDERVGDTLQENLNPMGRLYYNFSVLHCLPQALAHPGSAATGAVMAPSKVREYAEAAGFARMEVLPVEHPLFRLYRLGLS